ncbi:MAG: radical SAM protein [Candidatus Omnitrophica bacterium]|nr:radical SAM protein [Candidatus Omnitrophota bacterium]
MALQEDFKLWEQRDNVKYSPRNVKLKDFPEKVMFSFTGQCNLSCWHCLRSGMVREMHDSPRELIDYVNRKILPFSRYLRIGGNDIGEPLMSKNFTYFFHTLPRGNLKEIHLITNFTLLDEEKAELIAKNVNNLEISVEGTGADYSKIRHFPWDKLLENFKLLEKYRSKYPQNKLQITLDVCVMLSNLDSLIGIFGLKSFGVNRIVFREFHTFVSEKETECLWQDPEKTTNFIKRMEEKSHETGMPIIIIFKDKYTSSIKHDASSASKHIPDLIKCYFPWNCIAIDSLGNISCCCRDLYLAKIETYKENFFNIWNSRKFIGLRKTVNSKKPWFDCLGCELKMGHLSQEEKIQLRDKYGKYRLRKFISKHSLFVNLYQFIKHFRQAGVKHR